MGTNVGVVAVTEGAATEEVAIAEEAALAQTLAAAAATATEGAAAVVEAAEKLAAMTRQETVGGCKGMVQHTRQIDTAAAAADKAATRKTATDLEGATMEEVAAAAEEAATAKEAEAAEGPQRHWQQQRGQQQ